MDLVFYLKDANDANSDEIYRHEIRKRYWSYAIPIIQEQYADTNIFDNCKPTVSNTISAFFGMGGLCIRCAANYDSAWVEFYMRKSDNTQNKAVFDMLYGHKEEIEKAFGVPLTWDRADSCKSCGISYRLEDVSITREEDWPRMARFHAEWSKRICGVILPYLK